MKQKEKISDLIKAEAKRLGFFSCGISKVENLKSEETFLSQWLEKGYQANMVYMQENFDKRLNPELLVPKAKSVISVSLNYFPGKIIYQEDTPKISKYALGRDYHKVMKKKLKHLFNFIHTLDNTLEGRYFVDSAPILDKVWAEKSGLGWKGKHGLIINKDIGSFFFIGEIVCNLELEYDQAVSSLCGSCNLCIEACPTQAIVEAYSVDSKLCISYQTIENKQTIPTPIVDNIQNYIFGCDICQDVCPWNKKSLITELDDFGKRKDLLNLSFNDYLEMDEAEFNKLFNGTPIKRAGFPKIKQTIEQIVNSKTLKKSISPNQRK
jgi:epoxyqueuosine reductase